MPYSIQRTDVVQGQVGFVGYKRDSLVGMIQAERNHRLHGCQLYLDLIQDRTHSFRF